MATDDYHLLHNAGNLLQGYKRVHKALLGRLTDPYGTDAHIAKIEASDDEVRAECFGIPLHCDVRPVADPKGQPFAMEYSFWLEQHGMMHLVHAYYLRGDLQMFSDAAMQASLSSVPDPHFKAHLAEHLALTLLRSKLFAPTDGKPFIAP